MASVNAALTIVLGMMCLHVLVAPSKAEWSLKPLGIPLYGDKPIRWRLYLEMPTLLELQLEINNSTLTKIPIYEHRVNGSVLISGFSQHHQHTTYYHDLRATAAIGLTHLNNCSWVMGSFVWNGTLHRIEPTEYCGNQSLNSNSSTGVGSHSVFPSHHPSYYKNRQNGKTYTNATVNEPDSAIGLFKNITTSQIRSKRSTFGKSNYVVQLYMVFDYSIYAKFSEDSRRMHWSGPDDYITYRAGHIVNEMDILYKSIDSSSFSLSIKLSYIQIDKSAYQSDYTESLKRYDDDADGDYGVDSTSALYKIANWTLDTEQLPSDADHFMVLTSFDLYGMLEDPLTGLPSKSYRVLGQVRAIGGICLAQKQSLMEFHDAQTLAHELGHNLGAYHDATQGNYCPKDGYIMSYEDDIKRITEPAPWTFSTCSINYFNTHLNLLNQYHENCLSNEGSWVAAWTDDSLTHIGQQFTPDQQCQLMFDANWVYDVGFKPVSTIDLCRTMWCAAVSGDTYLRNTGGSAMAYTTCGNKKWCVEGQCQYDSNAPEANDRCPFGDRNQTLNEWRYLTVSCQACAALEVYHSIYYQVPHLDCSDITNGAQCASYGGECCQTCQKFETPDLGPLCQYGDQVSDCSTLITHPSDCQYLAYKCCKTCCDMKSSSPEALCLGDNQDGRTINLDTQCQLYYGSHEWQFDRTADVSAYDVDCFRLPCYNSVSLRTTHVVPTLNYTSCADHQWCKNGYCTANLTAPLFKDACVYGDTIGAISAEFNFTCEEIFNRENLCYNPTISLACCTTCGQLKSTYNFCPYGDRVLNCSALVTQPLDCQYMAYQCCKTCCDMSSSNFTEALCLAGANGQAIDRNQQCQLARASPEWLFYQSVGETVDALFPPDGKFGPAKIVQYPADNLLLSSVQKKLTHQRTRRVNGTDGEMSCSKMTCVIMNGNDIVVKEDLKDWNAFPHSTCGHHQWCSKSNCEYHRNASAITEICPYNLDKLGLISSDLNITCSELNGTSLCVQDESVSQKCCKTCQGIKPGCGESPCFDKTINKSIQPAILGGIFGFIGLVVVIVLSSVCYARWKKNASLLARIELEPEQT